MHVVAFSSDLLFSQAEQYFSVYVHAAILFLISSVILVVNVSPVNTMWGQGLARVSCVGLCVSGKEQRE